MSGARAGVEVRAALPSDAAELAPLLDDRPTSRATALRLDALARDPASAVLVATNWAGTVIGVVALQWAPSPHADRPVARLTALSVAPDERGSGIGRLLVKAASQAARTAGCDVLETAAVDPGFLLAIGFSKVGEALSRPLRKRV